MLIRSRKHFVAGIVMVGSFFAVCIYLLFPMLHDNYGNRLTGLQFADSVFNSLAKGSSYFLPEVRKEIDAVEGKTIEVNVPLEHKYSYGAARVLSIVGAEANYDKEGRLHFKGDLGSILNAAADVGDTVSDDGTLFILKSGLGAVAERVGTASGEKFAPGWKQEQIIFFLFGSQAWYDTYFYVNQYEWQKALDSWMSMLDTENYEKKACIEYNIAAACYILGRYDRASEWLELSGTHFDLSPYTGYLKEKIEKKARQ